MANVLWAVLCQDTVVDSRSNQISIINVIDQFNPKVPLPTILGLQAILVVVWEKQKLEREEAEDIRYRFLIVHPDGEEVPPSEGNELSGSIEKKRLRTLTNMLGIPIKQPGILRILIQEEVGQEWIERGQVQVEVTPPPLSNVESS